MAAPKQNQFYLLRNKHGRDKLFATSELLWEAALEYFAWCDNNPFQLVTLFNGKRKMIPRLRPYTLHGLCRYLGCNTGYLRQFKNDPHKCTESFLKIISDIEDIIYDQKFSGAVAGFFNANIISRDLGLIEKTASKVDLTFERLNDEQLIAIINDLKRIANEQKRND